MELGKKHMMYHIVAYNVMEKYMTSPLYDVIVYRQSNCDYRNIIAVPSYGLTVGENNGYANICL